MTMFGMYPRDNSDEDDHRDDWKYEVANGDTELGYADWDEQRKAATA